MRLSKIRALSWIVACTYAGNPAGSIFEQQHLSFLKFDSLQSVPLWGQEKRTAIPAALPPSPEDGAALTIKTRRVLKHQVFSGLDMIWFPHIVLQPAQVGNSFLRILVQNCLRRQFVYCVSIENAGFFSAAPSKNFSLDSPNPALPCGGRFGGAEGALVSLIWCTLDKRGGLLGRKSGQYGKKRADFLYSSGILKNPLAGGEGMPYNGGEETAGKRRSRRLRERGNMDDNKKRRRLL